MKKSGNQALIEALEKMLAMTDEELGKVIAECPPHVMTQALKDAGYFDRLVEELKRRKPKR